MFSRVSLLIFAVSFICDVSVHAQSELWLHVTDAHKQDVRDVQLSERESNNWSAPTSDKGLTKLDLAANIKPGDIIYLELHTPPNMKIALPPDSRVVIPKSQGPESVRVLRKGERFVLQVPDMIGAVAHAVLQYSIPNSVEIAIDNHGVTVKLRRVGLEAVATDLELSSSEIDQAIRNLPQSTTDPFLRAIGLLYLGDYEAAIEQLKKAQKSPPHDPHEQLWATSDTNFLLGQVYLEQGQFGKAMEALGEAVSVESHNPRFLEAYALSLYKGQRFADAFGVLGKLLKLLSKNKFIYLNQGFTLDRMGKTPEAIKLFEQYLNLEPTGLPAAQIYNRIGDSYSKAGDTDMALQSYRSALARMRQENDTALQKDSFDNMQKLYAQNKDPKIALAYNEEKLLTALQVRDKRSTFFLLGSLAESYAQQGETQKAFESYAQAMVLADAEMGDAAKMSGNSAANAKERASTQAISDSEIVPLLRAFATFLRKNNRAADAARIEARIQFILGK